MSKILIYDDESNYQESLRERLVALPIATKQYEIELLSQEDFNKTIETLRHRQRQLRETGSWDDKTTPIDLASIFVVDYDLVNNEVDSFLTGENIAYIARCFSKCGLIVALNQYPNVDFDLTLKGHLESFADLNINGEQLSNANLWGNESKEEFQPWYWPLLPSFQRNYERRIEDVKLNLDMPIWELLGFDRDLFDTLPRSITQFIGQKPDQKPSETTSRQFVLESDNGMRPKDIKNASDDILARVGAARISKWLERLVLPELDILVDAPHLVSRFPSLMHGDYKNDKTIWNQTTHLTSYTELGLKTDLIEDFRFKDKEYWLSRPAWFWDGVRECNEILEVREPWETFRPNWVFCEDISKFDEGNQIEFVAKVESPFARRFVKGLDGKKYQPRVRFSL
jgi:hypothetical protein